MMCLVVYRAILIWTQNLVCSTVNLINCPQVAPQEYRICHENWCVYHIIEEEV